MMIGRILINNDIEFMEVANKMGKQMYIEQIIIEHQHPLWTGDSKDPTYRKNDTYIHEDQNNYLQRLQQGFPR